MKINQISFSKSIVEERIFFVSEYLDKLNKILKPCRAIVQGEIGEKISRYPFYSFFNLLDKKDKSVLKCFTWREAIDNLGIEIEPGMEIRVIGYPEIRKDKGELKFQVEKIELVGEGPLKKQYEIMKRKLMAMGYFDIEKKKQIPLFCENIGLITSSFGRGALKDFLTNLDKFGFKIFFYDTKVEGSFAIEEIIEAINWFNQNFINIDVLVLIRGGGDWESLRPFNSEELVKAIFASKIPIITGIGHEDDETLVDFVADLKASTPTHAAKILSENWKLAKRKIEEIEKNLTLLTKKTFNNIEGKIDFFERNLITNVKEIIKWKKEKLISLLDNFNFYFQKYKGRFENLEEKFNINYFKINALIKKHQEKFIMYLEKLMQNQKQWTEKVKRLLKQQKEKLFLSNPDLKLKQGYSITFDEQGKMIKDANQLKISQLIKTKFYKGRILSKIKKIDK
jgi:exodeoxyribonuclease VII large subunit